MTAHDSKVMEESQYVSLPGARSSCEESVQEDAHKTERQKMQDLIEEDFKCSENCFGVDGVHFAFKALSVQAIKNWHTKAIENGATSKGDPGKGEHGVYYAAFVVDPDGWRLEAVLHHYSLPNRILTWLFSLVPFAR